MQKIITIEGMTCKHCQKRVKDVLNALPGIKAKVSFRKGQAIVTSRGGWNEQAVRDAIKEAGYEVTGIRDKRILFGG